MYTVLTTPFFDAWFSRLKDRQARVRIQARIDRVEDGNFGDHKSAGGGISELRIAYGPGYRLYYTVRGLEIVILLIGGDKSTQAADIAAARDLLKSIR
ncbi:MAG: type II toxin-antitoxin system RelE/ParE family toxin [Xanthomonadales bacterium PRO7]|nr:type II toxin-antitoxin system RelE/ParE family toxin [Xanthomonadales bacterium PRO7]